jgi:hypothetical protein
MKLSPKGTTWKGFAMLLNEVKTKVSDRTIPTRRERAERYDERVSDEVIRRALQAQSASKAAQEEA